MENHYEGELYSHVSITMKNLENVERPQEVENDKQYYLGQLYKLFDNMSSSLSSSCQTFAFTIACTIIAGIISKEIKGGLLTIVLTIICFYFFLEIIQFTISLCISKYYIEKIYNCLNDDEMNAQELVSKCLKKRKWVQDLTLYFVFFKIILIITSIVLVLIGII